MGCCKSSPNINRARLGRRNAVRATLPLTDVETEQFETLLSDIPNQYQQPIVNLPPRLLLHIYQYHKMALYHGSKREWPLAISYEHRAIKGFQALLPTDKDHYIFFHFYSVLSASFLALGELEAAIEGIYIALAILLKHTPMDYKTVSNYYYHLANAYKVLQDWKETAQYLITAIETAQLRKDPDKEFIRKLEIELQLANQQLAKDMSFDSTSFKVKRKRGENDYDFHRRMTAAIIISHSIRHFDETEFKYLSEKQTEPQVTDEILEDILRHLEKYVILNPALISVQFNAAQFKNVQMQTSPLSPTVIEAALTIIIDRLNEENTTNDELYVVLKKTPVSFTYTYENHLYPEGGRVFEIRRKRRQSYC